VTWILGLDRKTRRLWRGWRVVTGRVRKERTQPVWVSWLVWSLRKYPARSVWVSDMAWPGENRGAAGRWASAD